MIITNVYNIPQGIYDAIVALTYKPNPKVLRVTELIHPPIIKKLLIENWDKIEIDASENLLSLIGSGTHKVLQGSEDICVNNELNIRFPIPGFDVDLSGTIDRVAWLLKLLEDYKVVGVLAYVFGLKKKFPDYTEQINVYRWMIRKKFPEMDITKARLNMILRDWKIREARQDPQNYPPCPFVCVDIPLWSEEQANKYINHRLDLHLRREPRPCNDEERWHQDDVYAIKQKGKDRALASTDPTTGKGIATMERALQIIEEKNLTADYKSGKVYVEKREGQDTKCLDYCPVRSVCPYNRYNKKENTSD